MKIFSRFAAVALIEAYTANCIEYKPNRSYYGDSQDGIDLAETDFIFEAMTERKYAQTDSENDLAETDIPTKWKSESITLT